MSGRISLRNSTARLNVSAYANLGKPYSNITQGDGDSVIHSKLDTHTEETVYVCVHLQL